jgi:hypothetical protein
MDLIWAACELMYPRSSAWFEDLSGAVLTGRSTTRVRNKQPINGDIKKNRKNARYREKNDMNTNSPLDRFY